MAQVPKDIISSKGLNAKEWCDQVKEIIDGKGGGKPENAQASGTKPQVISVGYIQGVPSEFSGV